MTKVTLNPFTGNLDMVNEVPPTYVDGEVATYNDLPTSVAVAPVDSAYLVRQSSGVWLINYRPAGLWVRTGSGGTLADWTHAGVFPDVFRSNNFRVLDSTDATKALAFNLSGISTATTRTLTVPNADGEIMLGSRNLASLTNTATARSNLGIGSLSQTDGTLNVAGPSLTGSQAFGALALTQTWNTTGTPTAVDVNVTDIASNAASRVQAWRVGGSDIAYIQKNGYIGNAGAGIHSRYTGSSNRLALYSQGAERAVFNNGQMLLEQGYVISWSSAGSPSNLVSDLDIRRDAADILAQRRGTNAQTFRLYNTFTDASNHERGFMRWASNVLEIGTEAAGTGSYRSFRLMNGGQVCARIESDFGIPRIVGAVAGAYNATAGVSGWYTNAAETITRVGLNRNDTGSIIVIHSGLLGWSVNNSDVRTQSFGLAFGRAAADLVEINNGTAGTLRDMQMRDLTLRPSSSRTLSTNGDMAFEATSNTTLTIRYRGSDGTTRSVALTLT